MEPFSPYPELTERMTSLWERAMRIAARFALAFGLAAVSAIAVAIAVADNLFGQIFLVLFTTLALWIPYVLVLTMFDQWRARPRRVKASEAVVTVSAKPDVSAFERDWPHGRRRMTVDRSAPGPSGMLPAGRPPIS